MDEAEIEHLVGFVEDQDFERRQVEHALVDQVEQAARGGDEHVETAADFADRAGHGGAAEDHADADVLALGIDAGMVGDLRGKLAGRGEHQHPGAAVDRTRTIGGHQPVERRQHERRGLAGAGLGDAEQIAALQDDRDRLGLDRRGDRVILGGKRAEERRREAEIGKFGQNKNPICVDRTRERATSNQGFGWAPRVKRRAFKLDRDAGRVLLFKEAIPITPLVEASRVAVQYRDGSQFVQLFRHCERSEAIQRREMDCFAALAMTH